MKRIEPLEQNDTIAIQKSDWDMILSGEKWVLFLEKYFLSEKQKIEASESGRLNPNIIYIPNKIYFKDRDSGLILGEAWTDIIYCLFYDEKNNTNDWTYDLPYVRNEAIKRLYYRWCEKKSLKPNHKEGWFKSKKFSSYLKKIGWGSNYALFLMDTVAYEYETESVKCPWCEREQKIFVQKQLGHTSHKCESCDISFVILQLFEGSDNA
ncbi:hypothetical protein [Lysinibacillus sphaericus]|uniref:hypothetical protein n=1 Tax=Lysinibacillus sphaericus TaxID=1421 RepID=UPI0018CDF60A|nr:hypothetical protein [Lysinibacillus sphaericus]